MVLFVASLPVIFGITAVVVDMGNLYAKRAATQRAADAAALAGAQEWNLDYTTGAATADSSSNVVRVALQYAALNGYSAANGAIVTVDPAMGNKEGKVKVSISRLEPVYFAPVMDLLLGKDSVYSRNVKANAVAEKTVKLEQPLGGNYGTTTGASNPSAFGPYGRHDFGDPYSTKYYLDGSPNDGTKNLGTGFNSDVKYNPNGFDYSVRVPANYSSPTMIVQLFDPDTYNVAGDSYDEIRPITPNIQETSDPATKTRFSIYRTDDQGNITGAPLATQEYGGSSTDVQWDADTRKSLGKNPWFTPDGFTIPVDTYGKNYKVRVQTLDGSSENGYNLRVGPPESANAATETEWNNLYGDKGGTDYNNIKVPLVADGKLQMNFTGSGPVIVDLGTVPGTAKAGSLTVSKFDTDIGSQEIRYLCDPPPSNMPAGGYVGSLANQANDTWTLDAINLPADYKGGRWQARYTATKGDTSSWFLSYTGPGSGAVRLVE